MGTGILAIGAFGTAIYAFFLICLLIAPLIIWRNTNRTNRLLLLFFIKEGVPKDIVDSFYHGKGFGNDGREIERMIDYVKSRKKPNV